MGGGSHDKSNYPAKTYSFSSALFYVCPHPERPDSRSPALGIKACNAAFEADFPIGNDFSSPDAVHGKYQSEYSTWVWSISISRLRHGLAGFWTHCHCDCLSR